MKLSYRWLKEYLDFDQNPEELADILTMLGLEVGTVEKVGGIPGDLEGVVVGEVVSAEPHPNADRLKVCQVNIGSEEPLSIVCGAPNVAAGQKVPVATVGTVLYPFGKEGESFKIKKGKIRGEVSLGMICAEDELGLGPDHDGILVLAESLVPGTPFRETVELEEDHILEVDLTPNRIDAASHYGSARDLAAFFRKQAKLPELSFDPDKLTDPNPIPVFIEDESRCQRYTSVYIKGVKVGSSPEWLQNRLKAIGLRPINNVVDITNFVLHELGHPMHAFDADKISGGAVHVKTLDQETPFITLDEVERKLRPGLDLMICDTEKPLCIAGTMGGVESGVTENTQNVFLESAYFEAGTVRKTAKHHGISSDSSFRFERGADPNMTLTAALRATDLILQLAGGEASAVADLKLADFPPFEVELSISKTHRLIGKEIGRETILEILSGLEIEVAEQGDLLQLRVPPYRVDVQRDVDVIEDILRVYNYNNVELPGTFGGSLILEPYKNTHELRERYANYLSGNGYHEIMNNSLVAADLGDEHAIQIVNPLSEELGVLRQSMLPGALETVRHNQNRSEEDLALYEYGKTYQQLEGKYHEKSWLALTLTGQRLPKHWQGESGKVQLSSLTKEVERLQNWFGFEGSLHETSHPDFSYGLDLVWKDKKVLSYGEINGAWQDRYDLRNAVFVMLIDWAVLEEIYYQDFPIFQPIPQYPSIRRDLSLLLNKDVSFAEVKAVVTKANPKLIRKVELHDVYMGKGIGENQKSYLVSIELRDDQKTLADKAAEKVVGRAIQLLEKELAASLR